MSTLRPIFFDLETTGIRTDKDRIVEIAALDPVRNEHFQRLVHPGISIPQEASQVHGITDDMVQAADPFHIVAQEFVSFCEGNIVLVAHNGEAFDIPFLAHEFHRSNLTLPHHWAFVDSLKWARKFRRDLPRHSLQYLRQIFGIAENRAHRALDDVYVLHKVFSLMTDDLTYEEIIERIDGYFSLEQFTITPSSQKEKGGNTASHDRNLQLFS